MHLIAAGATLETLLALSAAVHHGLLEALQRLLAELDLTTVTPPDDDPENYTRADPTAGVTAKTPKDFQVHHCCGFIQCERA